MQTIHANDFTVSYDPLKPHEGHIHSYTGENVGPEKVR